MSAKFMKFTVWSVFGGVNFRLGREQREAILAAALAERGEIFVPARRARVAAAGEEVWVLLIRQRRTS